MTDGLRTFTKICILSDLWMAEHLHNNTGDGQLQNPALKTCFTQLLAKLPW